jgi:hypothetical protein
MLPSQKIVINVTDSEGNQLSFAVNSDSNLNDYKRFFKVVLRFLSFDPESIEHMFTEDEY